MVDTSLSVVELFIGFEYNEIDKSVFEKASEWDTTMQDTMEEYDNVER